jgi:hypothetical protein
VLGGWQLERSRLLGLAAELVALPWPPTVIIDSGNGIGPLWQLEAVLPNVEEHQKTIEALGRRIERTLGGIENASNVDRLLRLPGTINLPDARKLGKGRGPVLSGIASATWRRHAWRDLEALADHLDQQPLASVRICKPKPNGKDHCRADESGSQDLDLPENPPEPFDEERIAILIENNPDLIGPWETSPYPSQSERDAALASWARKHGWPICDAWALIITSRETFGDRNDQALRRDCVLRTLRLAYAKNGAATRPSTPASESSEWPEPGRIGAGISDASGFPVEVLPEVLCQRALDQADRMQAPIDFLAIPALVTLCGCIGKAPTLRPTRFDDWAEHPCLWAVLIADPASMKSVTLKAATDPLRSVENKKMAGWQSGHDAWKARQRECALREFAGGTAVLDGDGRSYEANEVLKAQERRVRLQRMKGELVDRAKAVAQVFKLAREERGAWVNWPAPVAAMIAAELEVDPHQAHTVLERHVRDHLAELAEVRANLR